MYMDISVISNREDPDTVFGKTGFGIQPHCDGIRESNKRAVPKSGYESPAAGRTANPQPLLQS